MPLNKDSWKNKFFVAAAGSGKTTFLVDQALKIQDHKVLITTYTEANCEEIKLKIVSKNKCIPTNITVQTWFSALIQHGIRPYQGLMFEPDIAGMNFVQQQSAKFVPESNIERHYFDDDRKIYSDKIAKFMIKSNLESDGKLLRRLEKVYPFIFVDEVQDLAGHDLELLKLLSETKIKILLVGDPRQGTFSTNNSAKNKKYRRSKILEYFVESSNANIIVDDQNLKINYRSNQEICTFSDKLFPEFEKITSGNSVDTGHDGIFLVSRKDVESYLQKFTPTQLRHDRRTSVDERFPTMNYGAAKGLTLERVLIYPTKAIVSWLRNNDNELKTTSRSKLYVAITRARFSVGIVCDPKDIGTISDLGKYNSGSDDQ